MKKFLFMFGSNHLAQQTCLLRFFVALFFLIFAACPASATNTNLPPHLTIDLQDGSRIVGTSPEKSFEFHSALLGDLKLEVKNIRSVECVSSNATKVTTANGDSFTVSFADSKLAVKTSFGKVELPTGTIRRLTVSARGSLPGPPGLVGFWSGNGEGKDSAGGNDAVLTDVTFADGMSGQAFSFNGTSSMMKIPANPAIDLGADEGLTIMAWVKPADVSGIHPIFQWLENDTWSDNSLFIWIGMRPDEEGVLRATLAGAEGNAHLVSQEGVLAPGVFQHIAYTYDKATGRAALYVNGVAVSHRPLGPQLTAYTKGDFWVSWRDVRPGNWSTDRMYSGLIDDIALYNRALSAPEVQSICQEENHGEPLSQPMPSNGWQELMR